MDFVPHTEQDFDEMLKEIGVDSFESLLKNIPRELRKYELRLPDGISEFDLVNHLKEFAEKNISVRNYPSFLGGGAYDHFIPSVVNHLASRSEFYTPYTPYQPEASQGNLQATFEYQTAICELTGMEISNASLYDGATAMAEAALASLNVMRGRSKIIVSNTVHPEYRFVLKTYMEGLKIEVVEVSYDDGVTDLSALRKAVDKDTVCVIMQSPNFFGCIEEMAEGSEIAHSKGGLFISVVNPISLGVLAPPGEYNADIAVGEGQPLGNPLSYGGPYLGFFACTHKIMRKVPGRIVGMTNDRKGRRGFVLTLQAREQHIRRERATSNICTNQALNALRACIYLCSLGKTGIREIGELNLLKSHYAYEKISHLPKLQPAFTTPFFNEFVVRSEIPPADVNKFLLENKIIGGLEIGNWYPELDDCLLFCVTETKTKQAIDKFVGLLQEVHCTVH